MQNYLRLFRLQQQLLRLNHPRLSLVLRWCVAITFVAVVLYNVYTANLKISIPSFDFTAPESAEANVSAASTSGGGSGGVAVGSVAIASTERGRYFSRKEEIEYIIHRERVRIARSLANYTYKDSKTHLSDHLMEAGGRPIRAMIATTWRSGSTFLGDILISHPATFYHYEPLLHFGIEQVREGTKAKEAQRVLKSLFNCDYSNLGELKYHT